MLEKDGSRIDYDCPSLNNLRLRELDPRNRRTDQEDPMTPHGQHTGHSPLLPSCVDIPSSSNRGDLGDYLYLDMYSADNVQNFFLPFLTAGA